MNTQLARVFVLFSLIVGLVLAQLPGNAPACGNTCLGIKITEAGVLAPNSDPSDIVALCNTDTFATAFRQCVDDNCPAGDVSGSNSAFTTWCENAAAQVTTVTASETSTSSSANSSESLSSTTSSSSSVDTTSSIQSSLSSRLSSLTSRFAESTSSLASQASSRISQATSTPTQTGAGERVQLAWPLLIVAVVASVEFV
ncbi:hypothetical protein ACM66B_004185 [Microbotryomycetes sp. NB124-2]